MANVPIKASKLANLIRILYDSNKGPTPKIKEQYIAQQLEREEETYAFLKALCNFLHDHPKEAVKVEEVKVAEPVVEEPPVIGQGESNL